MRITAQMVMLGAVSLLLHLTIDSLLKLDAQISLMIMHAHALSDGVKMELREYLILMVYKTLHLRFGTARSKTNSLETTLGVN